MLYITHITVQLQATQPIQVAQCL